MEENPIRAIIADIAEAEDEVKHPLFAERLGRASAAFGRPPSPLAKIQV
jgi:hypothetical protein